MRFKDKISKMRERLSRKREKEEEASGSSNIRGWLRIVFLALVILAAPMFIRGGGLDFSPEYFLVAGSLVVLGLCGYELLRVFMPHSAVGRSFLPLMLTMLALSICEVAVGNFIFASLVPAELRQNAAPSAMLAYPNIFIPFFVGMLYGGPVALVIGLVTSIAIAMVKDFSLWVFLVALCSTCLAARKAAKASTYLEVAKALLQVAALQFFFFGFCVRSETWSLFLSKDPPEPAWIVGAQYGVFYGMFAVSWAFLLLVLRPAEKFTKRICNVSVHRYVDLERPLLKRLSLKTPGTYHHVMMVGDLAQAAADAIGANGLLARAGAYYHDIGKLSHPSYYMENQSGMENPHDELPPNISRIVIMNHVKEGLVLARHHHLPEALCRFIQTHHGTSVARWFLMKEKKRLEEVGAMAERNVDADNFYRYPGPLPVTREETIVALADSVEAASRSMRFFDRAKIEGLVNGIVSDRCADGQLAQSELSNAELDCVRRSFITTLVHLLHGRLPYPSQK